MIANFIIGGYDCQVIIDTGATASFLPEKGRLAQTTSKYNIPVNSQVQTADNMAIKVEFSTELETKPEQIDSQPVACRYYILPNHVNIIGHEAVIGLDIIKKLQISVKPLDGLMKATIGDTIIGQEKLLSRQALSIIAPGAFNNIPSTVRSIIQQYSDIFSESATTYIRVEPMRISLCSDNLVKAKLRRSAVEDIHQIHEQTQTLLENDIIEPSTSNYSSNAHLVPKKNGKKRLVVNFIPLNGITIKDHYPLPQLPDLFNALRGAKYFAALDCTEGFFQIKVADEDRDKTAFITPHGLYHFKRCPFGFTNSPAKFQRTMNDIFEEGLYKRCVIYIDDILVYGKTMEELEENLAWVFQKCRQRVVKLKLSKCQFAKDRVEFLGFLVSHDNISPIPGKCDPTSTGNLSGPTEVLSVLGTLNYYSRFIENYAEKTKLLRDLTKKDSSFEWTPEHQERLLSLHKDLQAALPQTIPDTYSPKTIEINIQPSSVEAICTDEEGHIISRAGKAMAQPQLRYTTVEQLLQGLVLAYDKFGSYMKGEITVKTSCKALENTLKLKQWPDRVERLMLQLPADAKFSVKVIPKQPELETAIQSENPPQEIFYTDGACMKNGTTDCKASWAVLATLNPNLSKTGLVEHTKPSNQVAELTAILEACKIALERQLKDIVIATDSKYASCAINQWLDQWTSNGWKNHKKKPVINEFLFSELAKMKELLNIKCIHVKGHANDENNLKVDQMAKAHLTRTLPTCLSMVVQPDLSQTGDGEVNSIKTRLESDITLREKFIVHNNELYYIDQLLPEAERLRLFVPKAARRMLLRIAHDDPLYGGHLGNKKTRYKLRQYYWPRMQTDINEHIANCETCQHFKTPKQPKYGLLKPIEVSNVFEQLHIDIVGPIKTTSENNSYIITAIDAFSRYAYARARPDVKAIDIIDFINEEILSKHGLPKKIVSDNGTQFTSNEFNAFITRLGITHSKTTDYHPSANGMDERLNGSLTKILRNYTDTNQLNWDKKLIWALFLYNSSQNESTRFSPYNIVYGTDPRSPLHISLPRELDDPNQEDYASHENIRAAARKNIKTAQDRYKTYYDSTRQIQDFSPFDLVMSKSHAPTRGNSKKLAYSWEGPHIILKLITFGSEPQAVELLDVTKMKTKRVPFQDLKHFRSFEGGNDVNPDLPGNIISQSVTNEVASQPHDQAGRKSIAGCELDGEGERQVNDLSVGANSPLPGDKDSYELSTPTDGAIPLPIESDMDWSAIVTNVTHLGASSPLEGREDSLGENNRADHFPDQLFEAIPVYDSPISNTIDCLARDIEQNQPQTGSQPVIVANEVASQPLNTIECSAKDLEIRDQFAEQTGSQPGKTITEVASQPLSSTERSAEDIGNHHSSYRGSQPLSSSHLQQQADQAVIPVNPQQRADLVLAKPVTRYGRRIHRPKRFQ